MLWLLAFTSIASAQRPQPYDDLPVREPRLFWKTGVRIDGELVAADGSSLTWKSPFFSEPTQLGTDVVDRIEFPADKTTEAPTGAFSILFTNGDRLFADITALSAESITLKSDRHSDITLPFSAIQSLQRMTGGSVIYAGPKGVHGWKTFGLRDSAFFPWNTGPRGTLTPWHHDLTNNLLVQVLGEKCVRMSPPWAWAQMRNSTHCFSDWDNEPLPAGPGDATRPPVIECVIGPGEAIFLPVGWWHQVEALSLSASVSFTNFARANAHVEDYRSYGALA